MKSRVINPSRQYGTHKSKLGFTIVELLIVIVVIAILAAIALVSYNGVQGRAIDVALQSDLRHATQTMALKQVEAGSYPTVLPAEIKSSEHIELTLVTPGSTPVYSGLSPTQNAVLFFDTCAQLIDEGIGSKPDDNHDYISECRVYNNGAIDINGWNGRTINAPVTTASLTSYVNSYSGGSRDEFLEKGQDFMDTLASRFQAAGGTFPITQFWDSWATSTNGGIMKPTLPAPTTTAGNNDGTTYCVQAAYTGTDKVKHATQTTEIEDGPCSA